MKISDGLPAREAAWLTVLSVLFGALLVAVATGQFGKLHVLLWSQEAAGWAAAVGAVAAIAVSLRLARRAERAREKDELRQAQAVAEAICDELRAVHYQLEKIKSIGESRGGDRWLEFRRLVSTLNTPVLARFADRTQFFDRNTASITVLTFGGISRVRIKWKAALRDLTGIKMGDLGRQDHLLNMIPSYIPDLIVRIEEAVYMLWQYTPHHEHDPFDRDVRF